MSYGRTILRWSSLALLMIGLTLPARSVLAESAELRDATAAWKSLESNARRRQLREPWLEVIDRLEKVGRKSRSQSERALALMRAARAVEAMSEVSRLRKDVEWARRLYLEVGAFGSKERLADDALIDAARLSLERLGDKEGAREQLRRAQGLAGDRKADATRQLAQLGPAPAPAKQALARKVTPATPQSTPTNVQPTREPPAGQSSLEEATAALEALRADSQRRRFRHNWQAAIARLEAVGERLAPSHEGAIAYVRAARAAEELSRLSKRREDAERAVELYVAAASRCPKSTLVDDALLDAASLQANRLGRIDEARALVAEAIEFKGDRLKDARALQASWGPAPRPKLTPAPKTSAPAEAVARAAPSPSPAPLGEEDSDELAAIMASLDGDPSADAQVVDQVNQLRDALDDGELSLSEQAGLKVRRIIIDAGHGGHDTGAIGPTGVYEKDVTLAISRRLAQELRGRGYEVVLTREEDVFLALEERSSLANREKGDLFISVHANAHTSPKKSGVETYSLNVASDRYAMRLAARENATSERSVSDLQFMLADLATRANTVDSARLARFIQTELVSGIAKEHGQPRDLGVKHALFYVLLGARMPAVLVETAFVSNPDEEKKLASSRFQTTVARSIADGVDAFVSRRVRLASATP